MSWELGVLGPVMARRDGVEAALGGPRPRAVLASLLLRAGQVVPAERVAADVWGAEQPESSANLVQGYVSALRKVLGRAMIETRGAGYVIVQPADDLVAFERLASAADAELDRGDATEALSSFDRALALWRGPALADVQQDTALAGPAAGLDELRTHAQERRAQALAALGRSDEAVGVLATLVADHPYREHTLALLMTALYASGRQAEALTAGRDGRRRLAVDLGVDPGPELRAIEAGILAQDETALGLTPRTSARVAAPRTVLVSSFLPEELGPLLAVVEPWTHGPRATELLVVLLVSDPEDLGPAVRHLEEVRRELVSRGAMVRTATFTTRAAGADLARLAREQDATLMVIAAPGGRSDDERIVALLEQASCDVAVHVPGSAGEGPVAVPFVGAGHDWAAVELGAWAAASADVGLRLVGTAADSQGRDASRLLANASLAVQRALGVTAEPVLVDASPDAVLAATSDARLVVVGLPDMWRTHGLGPTRAGLAGSASHSTLLIYAGPRPGALARGVHTRFTWTVHRGP